MTTEDKSSVAFPIDFKMVLIMEFRKSFLKEGLIPTANRFYPQTSCFDTELACEGQGKRLLTVVKIQRVGWPVHSRFADRLAKDKKRAAKAALKVKQGEIRPFAEW